MPYANIKKNPQVIYRKREKDELPDHLKNEPVIERGLDDGRWKLLLRCWSKDPEDRPFKLMIWCPSLK